MLSHWAAHCRPDVTVYEPHPPSSPDVTPRDFHLLVRFKKHLADRRFATDADVKQAGTSWLQTLDVSFFYAGIQAVVP
jgi:hypothetical protein